jgi:hypothetical protein
MRFRYSTVDPTHSELDSLPWLSFTLRFDQHTIKVRGLVDSGATVNVLPYSAGAQLGAIWDSEKAVIRLAGSLGNMSAQPLPLIAEINNFEPVKLVFAWSGDDNVPLILGQMNFFMEFDVCFYRSQLEFEINHRGHKGSDLPI